VAQLISEEGSEFNAPFAERLMAHLSAALVQQFLDVPVTQLDFGHLMTEVRKRIGSRCV
jgi:hypothetical protein